MDGRMMISHDAIGWQRSSTARKIKAFTFLTVLVEIVNAT